MKQRFFIIALNLFCLFAYGQNAKTSYKTLDLLSAYLSSDLDLKKTALSVKEAELSSQQSTIQNGLSATLSTGTITFKNINKQTLNFLIAAYRVLRQNSKWN